MGRRQEMLIFFISFYCGCASNCIGKYYFTPKDNLTILNRNISSIEYNYFTRHVTGGKLHNTGETILMTFTFKPNMIPYIEGGPLGDEKYQFDFMYFHWIDKAIAAKNTATKYSSMYYDNLIEVPNPNDIYELDGEDHLGLSIAMSVRGDYSVYIGKSTNPNRGTCNIDVIWIEYDKINDLMPKQVQYFENFKASDGSPLMSRTITTVTPKSKIYHPVYLLEYEVNNWTIEAFEGLGISFDSSASLENMLSPNILILFLFVQLY
ncbi:uncharacterized protein [Musca autumnalis]|uniref:uncharacterized protein n=1 Tax=Musca autumnalis TaxID=221902 RepID=UPI003CF01CCF